MTLRDHDLKYLRRVAEDAKSRMDTKATLLFRNFVTPERVLALLDTIEQGYVAKEIK